MLKNFWYAVEISREVTSQPRKLTLMDKEYVLYRDTQGQVIALDNRCAHRGAGLALGWVERDCIRCPYHGWKYEANGSCTHIPADAPGTPIPKRASVSAYPVQEKYGFVWMFVGDLKLPDIQRPPIPQFPQFESPERTPAFGSCSINAHFTRTIENTIDAAHPLFVHQKAIGTSKNPQDTTIDDHEVLVSEWEMSTILPIKIKRLNSFMRFFFQQNDPNAKKEYRFALPNISYTSIQFGSYRLESIMAHVPVGDRTTVVKSANIRNFLNHVPLLSDWMDRNTVKVGDKILREDEIVVQTQFPQQVPYGDMRRELLISSDATQIAYRKLLKKYSDSAEIKDYSLSVI
jgi:phenylpropionate dioxygenase-like ring-hydroxylating dioxygenase large terminal subunit